MTGERESDDLRGHPSVVLAPIRLDDLALVDCILDKLEDYSLRVDGVPKLSDGARRLLSATPQGMERKAKHVFAILSGSEPIGLLDLIDGYPQPETAFLGLLAITPAHRGRGFGRASLQAAEEFAHRRLGVSRLRLAVVATNPALGFWRQLGFRETGEVKPHIGERLASTVQLLEKRP